MLTPKNLLQINNTLLNVSNGETEQELNQNKKVQKIFKENKIFLKFEYN